MSIAYNTWVFTPDSALTEALHNQSTFGYGELMAAPHCPEIAEIAAGIGYVAYAYNSLLFLTPPPESVRNPFVQVPATYEMYRGPNDHRSFSIAGLNRTYSVTVKGGDLPHMGRLPPMLIPAMLKRIRERQIPGAGLLQGCQAEFDAAQNLQERSLALQGRLTHTAVPLRVNRIDMLNNRRGHPMTARRFMDTDEYLRPEESDRARMNAPLNHELKLGKLLLKTFGLKPATYMYAIKGMNVRVESLFRVRHFADGDKLRSRGIFLRDHKQSQDSLLGSSSGLEGDTIPIFEGRKDAVFRAVYRLLGDAYGFDVDEIMPSEPINDRNYRRWLANIPHACQENNIDALVLPTFVDRITEVAALAHAHEFVLSGYRGMGGSLHARNVTLEGVVLDLNTMKRFADLPFADLLQDNILKDFNSLLVTVAKLERMVAGRFPPDLIETIYESYLSKLEAFAQDEKSKRLVANVIYKSKHDVQTEFILQRMRYDQPRL